MQKGAKLISNGLYVVERVQYKVRAWRHAGVRIERETQTGRGTKADMVGGIKRNQVRQTKRETFRVRTGRGKGNK